MPRPSVAAASRQRPFVGPNLRDAVERGDADYVPMFLSEVPGLFRRRILPIDVAMVHVSPPDRHGFCSLGTSVDVRPRGGGQCAAKVVAQINRRCPRTHGDGLIHVDDIPRRGGGSSEPLPEHPQAELTETERAIGQLCSELIEDGRHAADGHRRHPRRRARAPWRTTVTSASTPRCCRTASST